MKPVIKPETASTHSPWKFELVLRRIYLSASALAVLIFLAGPASVSAAETSGQPASPAAQHASDDSAAKAAKTEEQSALEKAPADGEMKTPGQAQAEDKRPYSDPAVKHYNRGVELHQSGFLNQAITEYRAAIDADARMEEAYSNLGLIYAAQRNYSKAVDAFTKALSLKPGRPTTLNGLGTVLYARGKVQEAMERWKQAIAVDPNFASAYYNMGNASENEKDYQSALNAYVRAVKINPTMADAFFRIGTLLVKDRHFAQAQVLLKRAVELAPDADFVRDAKKQLDSLDSQFAGGSDEPEVEMNVLPPPNGGSAPEPGSKEVGGTRPADKSNAAPEKSGQKVDMFIQPSQTERAGER